ncbi:hypothetical protein [Opitutus sp. GAS368]|jgi:hypothetical protein|uniref:hypothetical protein n=1 Tax=Opitutus sp. GAS368 TaxID=1882749 RepID=UPI00087A4748|nr:hypothetical protein [Opitutus sp. GAS368]SDR65542.1 hypothetical protein SAMN05444173_0072 [Opitutus sp. GAS368]
MWDWLFQFIDPLERAGIPYALVGSVASSIYGEPRATNDLDVVIQIGANDAPRLLAAFPEKTFYVPPLDTIQTEAGRAHGAHLNVIALEGMTKADLYPLPADQRTWFERRRSIEVAGRKVWVAAPEAIILHKLLFHRESGGEKHLRDVRAMLATLGAELDRPWLDRELVRLGLALPLK